MSYCLQSSNNFSSGQNFLLIFTSARGDLGGVVGTGISTKSFEDPAGKDKGGTGASVSANRFAVVSFLVGAPVALIHALDQNVQV